MKNLLYTVCAVAVSILLYVFFWGSDSQSPSEVVLERKTQMTGKQADSELTPQSDLSALSNETAFDEQRSSDSDADSATDGDSNKNSGPELHNQKTFDSTTGPVEAVFEKFMNENLSINELQNELIQAGLNPQNQRNGHPQTGFRREITLKEVSDATSVKYRLFNATYLEQDASFVFDRIYYGIEKKVGAFEGLERKFRDLLQGRALNIDENDGFIRFHLPDDKIFFIDNNYEHNGEIIILVGSEYEIH